MRPQDLSQLTKGHVFERGGHTGWSTVAGDVEISKATAGETVQDGLELASRANVEVDALLPRAQLEYLAQNPSFESLVVLIAESEGLDYKNVGDSVVAHSSLSCPRKE